MTYKQGYTLHHSLVLLAKSSIDFFYLAAKQLLLLEASFIELVAPVNRSQNGLQSGVQFPGCLIERVHTDLKYIYAIGYMLVVRKSIGNKLEN